MTRVTFKQEDTDSEGQAIGPVEVFEQEAPADSAEALLFGAPYEPNEARPWTTEADARAVAAEHSVELEIS